MAYTVKEVAATDAAADPYLGHSDLIVDSELRRAYEAHHSNLPEFASLAMKAFAKEELS